MSRQSQKKVKNQRRMWSIGMGLYIAFVFPNRFHALQLTALSKVSQRAHQWIQRGSGKIPIIEIDFGRNRKLPKTLLLWSLLCTLCIAASPGQSLFGGAYEAKTIVSKVFNIIYQRGCFSRPCPVMSSTPTRRTIYLRLLPSDIPAKQSSWTGTKQLKAQD